MRPATMIAVLLGLAALGIGCGAESAVEETIDDVTQAFAEGDGEEACDLLLPQADPLVRGFSPVPGTCPEAVESLAPAARERCREIEVSDVTVLTDDTARARISGPQGDREISLIRIDGQWKLRAPPCGPGPPT